MLARWKTARRTTQSSSGLPLAILWILVVGLHQPAQAQDLELISRDGAGQVSTSNSNQPYVSGDGRFVVFTSSFLLPEDTTGVQIYLFDRQLEQLELVSQTPTGVSSAAQATLPLTPSSHVVSHSGRFVLFASTANDLVPGANPSGFNQIYLRDRHLATTELVSKNTMGDTGNANSSVTNFTLAPTPGPTDWVWLAFSSNATNLDPLLDNDGIANLYFHETLNSQTRLGCFDSSGDKIDNCFGALSCNAGSIAFKTPHRFVVPTDGDFNADVFVGPPLLNPGVHQQMTLSVDGQNADTSAHGEPAISCDGRRVAFSTDFSILNTLTDPSNTPDVYVRDVVSGENWLLTDQGSLQTGGNPVQSGTPTFAVHGGFLALQTPTAIDPIDTTTPSRNDIYLFEFGTQLPAPPQLISRSATEVSNLGASFPTVSDSGHVVFESLSDNLNPDDTNTTFDVFASGPNLLFRSGFETGDTSSWSGTSP